MPEVFEHAFALLGERIEDHVELERLDPAYRLFPEPVDGGPAVPFDVVGRPGDQLGDVRGAGAGRGRGDPAVHARRRRRPTGPRSTRSCTRPSRGRTALLSTGRRQAVRHAGRPADRHARRPGRRRPCTDPVLRQVLGYHAVFLGSSPYRVPALYSLMSHLDLVDGVRFPRGGMYTVIEALERIARKEGVDVPHRRRRRRDRDRRRRPVAAAPAPVGRGAGVRLTDGEVRPRRRRRVRRGPAPHRDRPAAAGTVELPDAWWEDRGPGISALLVMAGVRGELPELAHHSLFFTRDWPGNFEDILGHGPLDAGGRPAGARGRVDVRLPDVRQRPDRRARGPREPVRARPVPRRRLDRGGRPGGPRAATPTGTSTRWAPGRASPACATAW